MQTVVILALCVVAIMAQAPPRPNIPDTFIAHVRVESHQADQHLFGNGILASDYNGNRALENYRLDDHEHGYLVLYGDFRYDLGQIYEVDGHDFHDCHNRSVQGHIPAFFGWVANATYAGQHRIHEVVVDTWRVEATGFTAELGVNQNNTNVPVIWSRYSRGSEVHIMFEEFNVTSTIDPNIFNVPPECSHNHTTLLTA